MNKESLTLNSLSLPFVEGLYAQFLRDPSSIPEDWKNYFESLSNGGSEPQAARRSSAEIVIQQQRVDQLIHHYRVRGHRVAFLDPLGSPKPLLPELDPKTYGFTEADMDIAFRCPSSFGSCPNDALPLREIVKRLQSTYCRTIGVEFMHIDKADVRAWLQDRMESTGNRIELRREEQIRILTRLTDAVVFEEFVRKRFIGAKTFSLEGGESLIPLLDLAIEWAGGNGVRGIVLAMAHRGRLNVLANILAKSPRWIFREFADTASNEFDGPGDVKYHLGYSSDWVTENGREVHLSLCFNPSHLEFVDPVALGRVRAKQDRAGDKDRQSGMALMIHGDASFAGQGIIQEILNLSNLEGYTVGGALHVILNNQLGFTTPPEQARSTLYCSDVAKMLRVPIFHVNGEDPEAVAQVVRLALEFRKTYRKDVVIDMYCYRKLGHNEGDEPSFTQPLLYQKIAARKSVREAYLDHLLKLGGLTAEEGEEIANECHERLSRELSVAEKVEEPHPDTVDGGLWDAYSGGRDAEVPQVDTGVDKARLMELLERQLQVPEGFSVHPKLRKGMEHRLEMARDQRPLDWAAGEALALASLAADGARIRLTGQDSERGTFSQRHAVLHDVKTGQRYLPLQHVAADQGPVELYNSPLSEAGVLGFEYGYSLDCPDGLVMWEAQFGDFFNAAQVIIDQFIASAEVKWGRLSGIVLLLPHGFEGSGPEHSSARVERFLTLAADDNLQLIVPTTPAQYFHALRRQFVRRWRKPLVVMTPKSLLRNPAVASRLDDFAGRFQTIIPDSRKPGGKTRRVLLCAGKIYYELDGVREAKGHQDVAIVRVEQLYPLDDELLAKTLSVYPAETPIVWVQEEPENMGAWRYMRVRLGERYMERFPLAGVSRLESASVATGSARRHRLEQERLLAAAFQT